MFSVDSYLATLGYSGPLEPTSKTLRELQRRHLMTIPFDNSGRVDQGTASLKDVDIDLDEAFGRVVTERRGGVCFELNGMFNRLLKELGFQTMFLGAGVRGPGGTYGPDLEHMFLGVRIGEELWLGDVGFAGPGFIDPLQVTDGVQEQYGCQYRVFGADGYHVVERKTRTGDWQGVYRFREQPRRLAEWVEDGGDKPEEDGWNWEGELVAADTVIRARSFETGQMVLVGRRLVRVDDGEEQVRVLVKPEDYQAVVDEILGGT
ncbi:MAG TPA: arylamine N-acetyltransferase [Thermomonospora sp.]|nr:arylamine N-acetyltransferase [Thermomonospora sp.]